MRHGGMQTQRGQGGHGMRQGMVHGDCGRLIAGTAQELRLHIRIHENKNSGQRSIYS
jgi:hypothetical protein